MTRSGTAWVMVVLALGAGACGGHEFEPPDRAQRSHLAAAAYAAALFDTVVWASPDEAAVEGNTVYVSECRNCHGPLGRGDTEYARERGLQVPSLVEAGWARAEVDSVRRAVYGGHEAGMPVFGVNALTLRDVDAVARYVVHVLRVDVLGAEEPPPPPVRPPPLP